MHIVQLMEDQALEEVIQQFEDHAWQILFPGGEDLLDPSTLVRGAEEAQALKLGPVQKQDLSAREKSLSLEDLQLSA